ncbi:uncharacterized protein LOC131927275 [Physella acuta]|uniref:uncharacterized protein LOC131927275 n=1 Tax=Physella acuta TaxID=109671 RepID=UPI0027DBCB7F|nr:uncharacterized protein LOC131927275 [Physella acuta]
MRNLYLAVLVASIAFGQETEANETFQDALDEILSEVMSGVNDVVASASSMLWHLPALTVKVEDWCIRMAKRIGIFLNLIDAEWSVLDQIITTNKKEMIKLFDAIPCNKLCPVCNILQRPKVRAVCYSYCKTTCRWQF